MFNFYETMIQPINALVLFELPLVPMEETEGLNSYCMIKETSTRQLVYSVYQNRDGNFAFSKKVVTSPVLLFACS